MLRMISILGCLMLTICFGVPSAWANKVLSLDGDGDYVEMVDSPVLNGLDTQVTIELWIRADEYNGWMPIIFKAAECCEADFAHRSFTLQLYESGTIHFTSAPAGSGQIDIHTPVGSIHLHTWYHIAGVIDAVNHSMKLFVNGTEVASTSYGDSIRTGTLPLRIGSSQDCCPNFSGHIDEVRIWNIARTQTEIQDNMNQPLENPASRSNLVGYWNFDSGIADDLSQYENHGDLYGGAHIADVIYVSPDGSPTGDGTKENPYDTIQRGIDESGRNDIVQVMPGTYEENIELLSDLTVLGSGAENTTITAASGNVVTANNVHNVSLSGFTIDGQGSADYGILCSGTTSEMEIRDNVITGATTGIRCSDSASPLIKHNIVQQNMGCE